MRLPKRIRFGAYTYKVRTGKNAKTQLELRDEVGEVRILDQHILITPNQHEDQARDTLLHECLHVIAQQTVTLKIYDEQEDLILRWTPVLLGLLRDNPELVDFLLA